jgi:hypothetical protein
VIPTLSKGRSRSVRLAATCALLLLAARVDAQRIERAGRGTPDLDRRIDAVAGSPFVVLGGDTLIARTDTLRGTAVVAAGRVRIDGVILGDLVALGGSVFLRPSAVVTGDVLNVAGGFYPSALATVRGTVISEPNAPYRVEQDNGTIRVIGLDSRPRFETDGFRGLLLPSYDRVDALTLPIGASLLLPRARSLEPRLRGRLEYRTARERMTGSLELALENETLRVAAGAGRATMTNDEWIRPRWNNSLAYFFVGNDYFDHYEADRAWVEFVVRRPEGVSSPLQLGVRAQVEDARSLVASNPWSLFNRDETRPNRMVDDGRIVSALLDAATGYDGATAVAAAGIRVELGDARMPLTWTDPETAAGRFGRYEAWVDLALAGFLDHALEIGADARGPLPGTDHLPRQRWTHVGGSGTIYTRPIAQFQGDRLAHVHTRYAMPIAAVRLPLLGPPTVDLIHVAAMAWSRDEPRDLEQNVGAGVRAGFLFVRYMMNPADTGETEFAVGFTLPSRPRPWQLEY